MHPSGRTIQEEGEGARTRAEARQAWVLRTQCLDTSREERSSEGGA